MPLIEIASACSTEDAHENCRRLEAGDILLLRELPFPMDGADRALLLRVEHVSGQKNIAYDTARDRLSGLPRHAAAARERLREAMRAYSAALTRSLQSLLQPYAALWKVDYASFRPEEEASRSLAWRARNDLLHTDAFAARPTNGDRILRVFTNLNTDQPRRWVTTDTFDILLEQLGGRSDFPIPSAASVLARALSDCARALGLPLPRRSPYDRFMLQFHDYLKHNTDFQQSCAKQTWSFPPLSTWIVFTDMVPHAVLSGRHALEQTYIVPHRALLCPERAPLRLLELRYSTSLTDPQ